MQKIESLCRQHGISTSELLENARVSRNAFYSLARKKSILPRSLIRIADSLGVSVSGLLDDSTTPAARMKDIVVETERILQRHSDADRDNIRHTLILLEEKPIYRLRRALRRGRLVDLR